MVQHRSTPRTPALCLQLFRGSSHSKALHAEVDQHTLTEHESERPLHRFRDLLVEAALRHGVVPLLLARLDWRASAPGGASSPPKSSPAGGASVAAGGSSGRGDAAAAGSGGDRDEAVARVLAVDVLHLLAAEGAHAAQVQQRFRSVLSRIVMARASVLAVDVLHLLAADSAGQSFDKLFAISTGLVHSILRWPAAGPAGTSSAPQPL